MVTINALPKKTTLSFRETQISNHLRLQLQPAVAIPAPLETSSCSRTPNEKIIRKKILPMRLRRSFPARTIRQSPREVKAKADHRNSAIPRKKQQPLLRKPTRKASLTKIRKALEAKRIPRLARTSKKSSQLKSNPA